MPILEDISGKRFGKLVVLGTAYKNKHGKYYWKCQCDCGNTTFVVKQSLKDGSTQSCGCYHFNKVFKGYQGISQTYWYRIQWGAKARNIKFDLSIQDAWYVWLKQEQKCALTGVELTLVTDYTAKHAQQDASLDRIDNNDFYHKYNIQWIHKDINYLKQDFSETELLIWCRKIVDYAKNKEIRRTKSVELSTKVDDTEYSI